LRFAWLENKITFESYDRETEGYSIAHCYLPAGQEFEFPDIFLRNSTKEDFLTENMKDNILTGYNKSYASETYRERFNFNRVAWFMSHESCVNESDKTIIILVFILKPW